VVVAMFLYARKIGCRMVELTDTIAPVVTIGLGAGRIGNFINGELWGRPTDLPWGMQLQCREFPDVCFNQLGLPSGTTVTPPLHPTSLYEATLEGLVLFIILWAFSARPRPAFAVSGLFLLCYGLFRSAVELVRMPDAHIDYLAFGWVTMGQVLTLPMILGGILALWFAYRSR
jgi:phosphatidylglycerol:prolipoprotein diacylglycerol transferase